MILALLEGILMTHYFSTLLDAKCDARDISPNFIIHWLIRLITEFNPYGHKSALLLQLDVDSYCRNEKLVIGR